MKKKGRRKKEREERKKLKSIGRNKRK